MPAHARRLIAPAVVAAILAVSGAAPAQSADVNLGIDQSQRIGLRGSVASVIVGNPSIADVTVVDSNTLFIVGKGYGMTEIVAVDGVGRTLFQNKVTVTGGGSGSMRVWRGAQATDMVCAQSCAPSLREYRNDGGASGPTSTPTP